MPAMCQVLLAPNSLGKSSVDWLNNYAPAFINDNL